MAERSGSDPAPRARRAPGAAGYSLMELVLVCALLGILVLASYPSVRFANVRLKETELRSALRQLRGAIDEHKRWSDAGLIEVELGTDGYPAELERLVEGIEVIGQVDKKIRFLRRIPLDPMTGEAEWGLRSFQDDPDATSWGGECVFDVYSLSAGVALDGTRYSEW
jgi:general secretion pathway protein G